MAVQWYPGHMNKARRIIKNTMSEVDLVIEVMDARIPYSSENPMVAELLNGIRASMTSMTRSTSDMVFLMMRRALFICPGYHWTAIVIYSVFKGKTDSTADMNN